MVNSMQDKEGLVQCTILLRQQHPTYILRLVLVDNLAEHTVAHRKAHLFCKRHFLLQKKPAFPFALGAGNAYVFTPAPPTAPQQTCRRWYPVRGQLIQIPKSLTIFGLSNSAMRAASLWKSACMSADASSFSIFTATIVKGSYGSSPGALQEEGRRESIRDGCMHTKCRVCFWCKRRRWQKERKEKKKKVEGPSTNWRNMKDHYHLMGMSALHSTETYNLVWGGTKSSIACFDHCFFCLQTL